MKMNKTLKRIVAGFTGIAMSAVILLSETMTNVIDVQATTKVFDKITTTYGVDSGKKILSILEIVDSTAEPYEFTNSGPNVNVTINTKAELGYFMPMSAQAGFANYNSDGSNNSPKEIWKASRALKYGDGSPDETTYANMMYQFYQYGLVKPEGSDNGWSTKIGEYPIYANNMVFSSYTHASKGNWKKMTHHYVLGVYSYPEYDASGNPIYITRQKDENGNYVMQDGKYVYIPDCFYQMDLTKYALNDNHEICELVSVSDNSVSDNSVSDNTPDYELPSQGDTGTTAGDIIEIDGQKYDRVPITDVVQTSLGLPVSASKGALITYVEDGSGNLRFAATEGSTSLKQYYGDSDITPLYYNAVSDNVKYNNGGWFTEFVLGSNEKYSSTDLVYDVKKAGDVTVDDIKNHDLIYISGTAEVYANSNSDISADVMLAIYNQEINYHKAVMMDFALYDADSNSNISKLCALLWQQSQSDLYSGDVEKAQEAKDKGESYTRLFTDSEIMLDGKKTTIHEITDSSRLTNAIIRDLKGSIESRCNGNFVTGNVYVYNHHKSDFVNPKSQVDALDNFANGDFNTAYTDSIVHGSKNSSGEYEGGGFVAVYDSIVSTNKASMDGSMPLLVTPAVVIQYILVSDGAPLTAMKATLKVLEIEPANTYLYNTGRGSKEYAELTDDDKAPANWKKVKDNRDAFIENYLSSFYEKKAKYISFESMSVAEFNARSEDLVETYDIIYIGDEIQYHDSLNNTIIYETNFDPTAGKNQDNVTCILKNDNAGSRSSYVWDATAKQYGTTKTVNGTTVSVPNTVPITDFCDDNMDGNIYYNIGDYLQSGNHKTINNHWENTLYGFLQDQDFNKHYKEVGGATVDNNVDVKLRYSGRDITSNKRDKLNDFLDSGSLVIVGPRMLGSRGTAKNTIVNPTATAGFGEDGDHGAVDNSSNLYEFLMNGLGYRFNQSTGAYENATTGTDGVAVAYPVKANLVSSSDILRGFVPKESLDVYVAAEKLSMVMTEKPVEYGYTSDSDGVIQNVDYLKTKDANGKQILRYQFTIESNALEGTVDTSEYYYPTLYIDINNDGKFSKTTEAIADALVVNGTTGSEAAKDESGRYILYAGVSYTMTRNISDDFSGLINWKLDIQSATSKNIHVSEHGYTAVQGRVKEIDILQITKDSGSNLGLETQLNDSSKEWYKYLNNVPGYELHIDTVTVSNFQTSFQTKYNQYVQDVRAYNQLPENATKQKDLLSADKYALDIYFAEYKVDSTAQAGVDMLVCGFGDDITCFTNNNAVSAVKAFIEAGNPVLMAHDYLKYTASSPQTRALRQLIGMDKYGVTQNVEVTFEGTGAAKKVKDATYTNRWLYEGSDATVNESTKGVTYLHGKENSVYQRGTDTDQFKVIEYMNSKYGKEVAYYPGSARSKITTDNQGYSNMVLDWYRFFGEGWIKRNAATKGKDSVLKNPWGNNFGTSDFRSYTVEQINNGQITTYPYLIPENFKVSTTHSQYFELDLSTDADLDGESDTVVWYALGENDGNDAGSNLYSDTKGGSLNPANGYYIYNKGNVTYTGAGHSSLSSAPNEEKMLFVNTLLAAYERTNQLPSVGFYDSLDGAASPITTVVVPYDGNITDPDLNEGDTTVDSSVLKNTAGEYKYQFVDGNDASVTSGGTMVYYRVNDDNFVRGTKEVNVKYYMDVKDLQIGETYTLPKAVSYTVGDQTRTVSSLKVETITVDGKALAVVDVTPLMRTYKTNGTAVSNETMSLYDKEVKQDDGTTKNELWVRGIESGKAYGIYLPMNQLDERAYFNLYVRANTTITTISTSGEEDVKTSEEDGFDCLNVTKADLLNLD